MKKTWKECMYDFFYKFYGSYWVAVILVGLALTGLAGSFFLQEHKVLSALLLFLSMPVSAWLSVSFDIIVRTNKKTFLSNKVTDLLFADEKFASMTVITTMLFIFVFIIFIFPNSIIQLPIFIGLGLGGIVIKKQILNHFKKKVEITHMIFENYVEPKKRRT